MRILFLVLLLLIRSPAWSGAGLSSRIEECRPLQELLAFFEIPLDRAIPETQRLWLQKGKERWEFDRRCEERKPELWPLFEKMGLLEEIAPMQSFLAQSRLDYALVHGALKTRVEARIGYLQELWKRGIRFDRIVFLTGARPLLDSEKVAAGLETEGQMVRWVYERSDLPKEIPVFFIEAPRKASGVRPQTADTVLEWLKTNPTPGSCLAISNQPFVAYQQAVLRRVLPEGFALETAGPAVRDAPSVALLLDTIAKELFWLQP